MSLHGLRDRDGEQAWVPGRERRFWLGNERFHPLQQFPRNTSRTCSQCGSCGKANRKSQVPFACLHCGFPAKANFNASCNIARLGREAPAELSCSPMFSAAISG